MKIGILTFHDGINYGAFFQVYALQSFLLRQGFDCQVINYKSWGFTLREYRVFLDPRHVQMWMILRNLIKIAKFKMAHRKLHLTARLFREEQVSKLHFDRIVIGSDEVWNFETMLIGYDPVYFSRGLNAGRLISYAPSFGMVKTHESVPEQLRKSLDRIEYISVRDENSAFIMRAINEKPVQIVLDPTILVDLKQEAILPNERGYILIYGSFSEKMIRQVLEYSRLVGKKIISVGYHLSWCDKSLDILSPFQWLGYFANCDCVITTMFHGMIFSIMNQREFCMFSTPYRRNKVGNFLSDLGLSSHIIDENGSIEEAFAKKIDYSKVNAQLEIRRSQSVQFLLGALRL